MFYYVKDLVVAIACCAVSGKLGLRVTRQGSVDLVSLITSMRIVDTLRVEVSVWE